jgi:hypothetical protein
MKETPAAWYRHRWPWILAAGPAIVVAASLWTWVLAARTAASDGLVTEDYYRQGLAINHVLDRTRHAAQLHVGAHVSFDGARVRAVLAGAAPPSAALRLAITSPAHAREDQRIELAAAGNGTYESAFTPLSPGVHRVVLEDREGTWRLEGAMRGHPESIELGARGGSR